MLETISDQKQPSRDLDHINSSNVVSLFDKDGNNYLDFAEFLAAYIAMERKRIIFNG